MERVGLMTKIEEVAKGMWAAACPGEDWDAERNHKWHQQYRVLARAAVEAMRGPSEGMQKAFDTSGAAYDSGYCDFDDFEQSWNAAIDYALAP